MEGAQLVENVVPALDARMAEHLAAGDHLEGATAQAQTDPDADVPWILALARPLHGQMLKVVIAEDEVVGAAEDLVLREGVPDVRDGGVDVRSVVRDHGGGE
jgi:hypothetical protein